MRKWKVGEKISTVLNYPILMEGTVPMHILLEVVDVVRIDGQDLPKCVAIGISPIEDQDQILRLLQDNRDFPPNYVRLKLRELQTELSNNTAALDFFNKQLIDVPAAITEKATGYQDDIDKRNKMRKRLGPFGSPVKYGVRK